MKGTDKAYKEIKEYLVKKIKKETMIPSCAEVMRDLRNSKEEFRNKSKTFFYYRYKWALNSALKEIIK